MLNLDGEPVRGVPVTIWQANAFGRYLHVNDPNPASLDPHFVGCVGIRSDDDGIYRIKTVKPGAYAAGRTIATAGWCPALTPFITLTRARGPGSGLPVATG